MKTTEQIDAEIAALHACTQRLRQRYSAFGDDNVACIGVQICVLEQRMTLAAVEAAYTPKDPHDERQCYLYDEAMLACEWMHDVRNEEPQLSGPDGWGGLCLPAQPTALDVVRAQAQAAQQAQAVPV